MENWTSIYGSQYLAIGFTTKSMWFISTYVQNVCLLICIINHSKYYMLKD
jgi:hypothetical protein